MSDLVRAEIPLVPLPAGDGGFLARLRADTRGILMQPAVRKAMPLVVAAIAVAAMAMLWTVLKTADYRPLFPALAEEDKQAVVDALTAANYKVNIDPDTGNVRVSASDYHKAKMLLAAQGLPKAAATGYDLLDKMPLGSSRALEAARLQQSQESELARSVAEISGVENARVHLALPEQSVFVRDRTPPTASVFVKLSAGRVLGDSQVRSIVHLVSSSVAGLSPDNVSVVDQSGALLTSEDSGDGLGESAKRVAYQTKLEDMYRQRLSTLLTPILGAGNFTGEVHLDLDFTDRQATRESYDRDGVLRNEQTSLQVQNGQGAGTPRGIPGALTNQAPPAGTVTPTTQGSASSTPNAAAPGATPTAPATNAEGPRSEASTKSYDVGKEVSVTHTIAGDVKRASVAVVIREMPGKKISPADVKAVDQLVRGALGINAQRGDTVAVTSRAFIDPTSAADQIPWYKADWIYDQGKNVAFVLVAAMVLFGFVRPAMKKSLAKAPEPVATPTPPSAFEAGAAEIAARIAENPELLASTPVRPRLTVSPEMLTAAKGYDDKIALVRMLVADDTARASNVLKQMMKSEMPVGAGNE